MDTYFLYTLAIKHYGMFILVLSKVVYLHNFNFFFFCLFVFSKINTKYLWKRKKREKGIGSFKKKF